MKKSRLYYLDMINIIACIAVVIMHCTDRRHLIGSGIGWNLSVLLQALCIWAVTAFFMISGANLLEYRKKYNTSTFLKKRVLRIVFPFIVWSVIYALWKNHTGQLKIHGLYEFAQMFMENKILSIFWFFYTLIPAYFCIPFLSLLVDRKDKKLCWFLVLLGGLNIAVFPLLQSLTGLNFSLIRFPIGYSPVCLLLLGWLLKKEQSRLWHRIIVYISAVVSIVILYFSTVHLSCQNNTFDKTYMTSSSVFAICIAAALWLFFKHSKLNAYCEDHKDGKFVNGLKFISSTSLGVYFIQKIVIWYVEKIDFVDKYSIIYSVVGSLCIWFICVCIVSVLKKIPVLKWLVP